ncbi:hypothetical protein BCR36DRAFT_358156, partial [Piromyces finnis]
MANINNLNNFIVQPPNLSWLNFTSQQGILNTNKSTKENSSQKNKGIHISWRDENKINCKSQSFINLTKLLTNNRQYGLMDEYAGTLQEREEVKRQLELKLRKKIEEKRERKIADFEDKLREEYSKLDDETLDNNTNSNENSEDDENKENEFNENDDSHDIRMDENIKEKEKIITSSLSNSLEKINTHTFNKKDFSCIPYSAPVKSNKEENLKDFGLSNTSLEKLNRRNSYDQYMICLNEPMPDGSPHKIASVRPSNHITIISNNHTTLIEINEPKVRDEDTKLLKDLINGVFTHSDDQGQNQDQEDQEEDLQPTYNNRVEKFKMTGESSSSLNVLLENVDIKCHDHDLIQRNDSSDSLESIDFKDREDTQNENNNKSWFSSLSRSIQSWMYQRNEPEYEKYFTTTDNYGNIHVMSVDAIAQLYNIEYEQAVSIHDYVCSVIPKFPTYITSYTKYIENLNTNGGESREAKTLELIYKNKSIRPIITSDLALKLQAQLPVYLRGVTKWTMQYSLSSLINSKNNNNHDTDNNSHNNAINNNNNLIDLIEASQNSGGPCLLILQDDNNYVFGIFINEALHNDDEYFGINNWFLWKYNNSELEVYKSNDIDDKNILLCNGDIFTVGGVDDSDFALYLDKFLRKGHSYHNNTIKSKCLASFENFYISELELWTFN